MRPSTASAVRPRSACYWCRLREASFALFSPPEELGVNLERLRDGLGSVRFVRGGVQMPRYHPIIGLHCRFEFQHHEACIDLMTGRVIHGNGAGCARAVIAL